MSKFSKSFLPLCFHICLLYIAMGRFASFLLQWLCFFLVSFAKLPFQMTITKNEEQVQTCLIFNHPDFVFSLFSTSIFVCGLHRKLSKEGCKLSHGFFIANQYCSMGESDALTIYCTIFFLCVWFANENGKGKLQTKLWLFIKHCNTSTL